MNGRCLMNAQARRFLLRKHGLLGEPAFAGKAGVLDFADLADRVSDDLFGRRLAIAKAARDLPLGNRAELTRWRHACARMFARILHDPANALRSA